MQDSERAGQVVQFWRAIEMFSPQGVPKPTALGAIKDSPSVVLDVSRSDIPPWDPRHDLAKQRLRKGLTWQFTVYGGLYDVSSARAELIRVFGEDSVPADGRKDGQTALFAFTVDADGCLVENSPTLSACAWAVSRLRSPGPDSPTWLNGFDIDEQEFVHGLNRLVPPKRGGALPAAEPAGTVLATVGNALGKQVKAAANDAAAVGAKATGAAVKTAVTAGAGSVAGSVVGGIAGSVAGAFAEKLLTVSARGGTGTKTRPGGDGVVPQVVLTMPPLHYFVEQMASGMEVRDALKAAGVRVSCVQVAIKDSDEAGEQNFLNSFIADDLSRIERAVCRKDVGSALRTYLLDAREVRVDNRVDVRAGRDVLLSGVAPNRSTSGRWPAATSRPLVVSQQFAVNQLLHELAHDAGIFAVNGPPGTGKTTMLRDVLAAVVVARARKLAELKDPADGFSEVLARVPLSKNYVAPVRAVRPELTGFEIVVATASNDAAANVTAEIPSIDAVHGAEDEALAVDYFPHLASHVLGREAWGMVAAVLGNMKNRVAFAGKFWWGELPAARTTATATAQDDEEGPEEGTEEPGIPGMVDILKEVRGKPPTVEDWRAAVATFTDADAEVRKLAEERQAVAADITRLARCQAALQASEQELKETHATCDQLALAAEEALARWTHAQREFDAANGQYEAWPHHKPGFWVSLSTWFRAGREWAARHAQLADQRGTAADRLEHCRQVVAHERSRLSSAHAERDRCEKTCDEHRRAVASVWSRIDSATARWPGRVPFGDQVGSEEQFQLCAAWADEDFTAARTRLFLAALRLHKAFLFGAERQARGNLAVIATALRGRLNLPPEALLAAWQSLFLVVPMISTTFASLPRLLKGLDRESLGWLFVDEAGQASPQQVVGALWRCRRAVVVGDPQQLVPIVTLPLPAQHAVREHYGVHEQWTPQHTSAQRVADRHARHGTTLQDPDGEGETWVGAPLRVHRRCDRPMFDISNTIAYGGDLMVYGTNHESDFPGANTWIDVRSAQTQGKWVPAEGEALTALLTELTEYGVSPSDIRVISPFRDVVERSKKVVQRALGEGYLAKNVGTIHTVQGQESDVVILVLGGSASHNARARQWAADTPNLLNVAASRAKRRLYVIGNRANWKDLRYFNVLAAQLDVRQHET